MEIPIHLKKEEEIEIDFPNLDKPNDQPSVQPESSQRTRKTYPIQLDIGESIDRTLDLYIDRHVYRPVELRYCFESFDQ